MLTRVRWPGGTGVVVMLLAAPVQAQDVLTIEQATREVLAHNPALRASAAAVAGSDAGVAATRAGWYPRLSVGESWQRGDQPVFVFSSLLASRRFAAKDFAIDTLNHPATLAFHHTSVGLEDDLAGLR